MNRGFSVVSLSGALNQAQRFKALQSIKNGRCNICVATDVAARGLDIPLIQHVINYDLPQVPEDYVHRIGRTARAGSEGSALTFLTPDDRSMWNSINKLINPNFKPAPSGLRNSSKTKRRGKRTNNKKRKFREEKKFDFKRKRKFFKKNHTKPSGFTNNPKYFGKKPVEILTLEGKKKKFNFKGKRKFKSRNNRPKQFTFKKHNKKRRKF